MGKQEGTASQYHDSCISDLTLFLVRSGHTETLISSPASQGTDHVTGQVRQTSTVPGKPPSPSTTSLCC